jgi:hypothetical protein
MKQNSAKSPVRKPAAARKNVREAQQQIDAQNQSQDFNQQEYNVRVAIKAYELFERRGFQHGFHVEDWLQAEQLIKENTK